MTWFQAFRGEFGFSHYSKHRISVTADIPFATTTYTCILISVAAIIAAAGIRGKERWYTLIRLTYGLAVGSLILVTLFGYSWQSGDVGGHFSYIYRSEGQTDAKVGIRIGLHAANLTLSGTFKLDGSNFQYNEQIELDDVLESPQLLLSALERGLPQPLLMLVERLNTDEGGIRFGRSCWMAGYFAYILLWTAFAFWITSNILLCSEIWYGAVMFFLTGVCMILAVVAYHVLCAQTLLILLHTDGPLVLRYDWCFWTVLAFGILTSIIGLTLITLDQKVPKKLAEFFLLDKSLDDGEQFQQLPLYSTPVSRHGTPDAIPKQIRSEINKQSFGTAVQWHMQYGFDNHTTIVNPIYYTDTIVTDHVCNDSERQRDFGNRAEKQCQQTISRPQPYNDIRVQKYTMCSKANGGDKNHNTLTAISVDVSANPCTDGQKQLTNDNSCIQELDATNNIQL